MGQAKQRGTFEQRKAEAIERERKEGEAWRLKRQAMRADKTTLETLAPSRGHRAPRILVYTAAVVAMSMASRIPRDEL